VEVQASPRVISVNEVRGHQLESFPTGKRQTERGLVVRV